MRGAMHPGCDEVCCVCSRTFRSAHALSRHVYMAHQGGARKQRGARFQKKTRGTRNST